MAFPALGPWLTGTITQKLLRMAQGGLLGRPTATFAVGVNPTTGGGSHGVVGGDDLKVTVSSGLTMTVAAGAAFINGTSSTTQGTYYTYNDAAATIALTAHNAQPRIDLVYVRARDNAEDSGGATAIAFDKVTGTPAGSPAVPTVPSGALVLAQIAVPATSGAVVITDTRPYAAGLGGTIRCKSTLRPTGAALWQGQRIHETDTNDRLYYNGTAWRADAPRVTYGIQVPATNQDAAGAGTFSAWGSVSLPVPTWATTATVITSITGWTEIGGTGGGFDIQTVIGSAGGGVLLVTGQGSNRQTLTYSDQITGFATGTQTFLVQARQVAGTNIVRADGASSFRFHVTFQ